jgi:hypothetical protein
LGRPVSHDLQQQPFVTHTHIAVGKKNQVLLLSTVFFLKSFFQRSQRCSLSQELLSKISTLLSFSRASFKDGDEAHNAPVFRGNDDNLQNQKASGIHLGSSGSVFPSTSSVSTRF